MLFFIACLIGQFAPAEVPSPTIDEFREVCVELKQRQIAHERRVLEDMKPNSEQVIQPSRIVRQQIENEIKIKEAILKKIEQDETLLPAPQVMVQTMQVGQVGELFSRVVYTDIAPTAAGTAATVERIETRPAVLTVLKTYRPNAIVCVCDKVIFVLVHHKGPSPANGEAVAAPGIYRVAGHYTVGGKTLLAVEPWEHNVAWQKKFKRPEPSGKIEVALPLGERVPVTLLKP